MICHVLLCRDFPHNLIANILVSLTLKDTRAGLKFLLGADGVERWGNRSMSEQNTRNTCIILHFTIHVSAVSWHHHVVWNKSKSILITFFKEPFFKNKYRLTPETTWRRLKGCTCSSASTRCPQISEGPTRWWRAHQLTASSQLSPALKTSWSSPCFVWLTTCSTQLMWVEVNTCVFMCPMCLYSRHSNKVDFFLIHPLQSQSTPPEYLVRCFSLLTGVLAGYVSTGFLTEEEACRSQLFTKAKVYIQTCLQ